MNRSAIAPATKLKRGTEHYLDGKSIYIERDRGDGTVLITDDPNLSLDANYWNVLKSDLQQQPKFKTTLKVVKDTPEDKSDKKDLNSFFDSLGDKVPYNCQNCKKPLYAFNKPAKRAVSCHILPKKEGMFPELAKDEDNIFFMGVVNFGSCCNDHPEWDSSVEKRKKMPIYDYAINRYLTKLRPKLSEPQQVKADDYLGITKKSGNLLKDIQEGGKV